MTRRQRRRRAAVVAFLAIVPTLSSLLVKNIDIGTLPGVLHTVARFPVIALATFSVVVGLAAFANARLLGSAEDPQQGGPPAQLPDPDKLFGRHLDRLALMWKVMVPQARLGRGRRRRVVSLHGKPGVGKTSLALSVALSSRRAYPDGQVFVEMRGMRRNPLRPVDALEQVLRAIHATSFAGGRSQDELSSLYRSELARARVLVVLDDIRDEAQLGPLLPGPRTGSLVMVTSRRRLTAIDDLVSYQVEPLPSRQSVRLLLDRADSPRSKVNREQLAAIAVKCEGIPLALRIAAVRAEDGDMSTLERLIAGLSNPSRVLTVLQAGDAGVRKSFAYSYELLDPISQKVFRRLGLVPQYEFTARAVASLVRGTYQVKDTDEDTARDSLERLVAAQLVEKAGDRYKLLDLMYALSNEFLLAAGEVAVGRKALLALLKGYRRKLRQEAKAVGPIGLVVPRTPSSALVAPTSVGAATSTAAWLERIATHMPPAEAEAVKWLTSEYSNALAMMQAAARLNLPRLVCEMEAAFMFLSWHTTYRTQELLAIHQLAYESADELGDNNIRLQARTNIGATLRSNGNAEAAVKELTGAIGSQSRGGLDPILVAECGFQLAHALRESRQYDDAELEYKRAARSFSALGWEARTAATEANLGLLAYLREDLQVALSRLRAAASAFAAAEPDNLSDRREEAWACENLGDVLSHSGDAAEAAAYIAASERAFSSLGDQLGLAYSQHDMGVVQAQLRNLDAAEEQLRCSSRTFAQLNHGPGQRLALFSLAALYVSQRRFIAACRCLRRGRRGLALTTPRTGKLRLGRVTAWTSATAEVQSQRRLMSFTRVPAP